MDYNFIWGENQKKKFLPSSLVEALILFNEDFKFLWVGSGRGWSEGEGWYHLQEKGLWSSFLLVDCCG